MLELYAVPHRTHALADSHDVQKLFLKLGIRLSSRHTSTDLDNRVALLIAVDTSGSMRIKLADGSSKLERAIEAVESIQELAESGRDTEIGLVHFDTDARVLMELTNLRGGAGETIAARAAQLRNYSGGTRLELALRLMEKELSASQATVKKVIVLTDGETTDAEACERVAQRLGNQGVALICIGLGAEYNEDLLATLADVTNGFLYHLSESEESLAEMRDTLWDGLLRAERELVTDLRLRLDLDQHSELCELSRVYPMVQALARQAEIWRLGNVAVDDEITLIADIDLPRRPPGVYRAVRLTATYDIPAMSLVDQVCTASADIRYTHDVAAARSLDQDVVFFVRQARIRELADAAVQHAKRGQVAEAKKDLAAVRNLSQKVGNPVISKMIESAYRELEDRKRLAPETMKAIKVGAKTKTILAPATKRLPD